MKQSLPGNIGYTGSFIAYWGTFGITASFASVFLLGNGYSNTELGLAISLANIFSVLIQPVAASISDNSKRFTALEVLLALTLVSMLGTGLLLLLSGRSLFLIIVYALVMGLCISLQPLFNSLGIIMLDRGVLVDYGIARGVGSLGYCITVFILGRLTLSIGIRSVPWSNEVVLLLQGLFLLLMLSVYRKAGTANQERQKQAKQETIPLRDFIKRHKIFLVMNVGILFLFVHHQVMNYYMLQVFEGVGGTSSDMGFFLSLITFFDMPPFLVFSALNKHFSSSFLLKVACVGFVLRALIMTLAQSPQAIFLCIIVHMPSFPLFVAAIVKYITEIMNIKEAVRGQSVYVMSLTVGTVLTSLAGGFILDAFDARTLLIFSLIMTTIGAAVVILLADKARKE